MRELKFGEAMPNSSSLFATVKQKGDSITFRIAKDPVYTGKHFTQGDDGKWVITDCPRINNPEEQETCETCEHYFEIMKESKLARETGDVAAAEDLKKKARPYNVSVQFYFPILNRDNKQFQVLRTTLGVRNQLDDQFKAGTKVMDSDWVLRNTGKDSPRDLYSLTRKDSAETPELDDQEKDELQKALDYDMSLISENTSKRTLDDDADDSLVESAKEVMGVK